MKTAVRKRAVELGFDDCRFTSAEPSSTGPKFEKWLASGRQGEMSYLERNGPKRLDPRRVLPGARTVICLAVNYGMGPADKFSGIGDPMPGATAQRAQQKDASPSGLIARYARFADYHEIIGERLRTLSDFINHIGGPETRSLGYVDTGPILERDLAQRAGLGFVGKHANLISREFGNWILLAEVLTTLELDSDPPEKNRCGKCSRCLAACPTGAITAPFELDARLCISYLTIELKGPIPVHLRPAIGNRVFGCDDCLAACPWNRFAREGRLMRSRARPELGSPDLLELLRLDEAGFKARFSGTPMTRAKRRGLLRNVCVALGNAGDPAALPALQKAASDLEPLIAEHAAWAINQIQKPKTSCQENEPN